jgi:VCBS repeat-containing protein
MLRSRALQLLVPLSVAVQVAVPVIGAQASTAATTERPPAVQAQMADTVVDGLGVNIHLLYGNTRYADFPAVQAALADLGVRHVRDSLGNWRKDQYAKVNALAAAGVKTNFTFDKVTDIAAIGARLDMIANNMAGAVESLEPPNEYNLSGKTTWAADLRAYQPELYRQMRARRAFDGVSVLGPSLALRQGYAEVGDLSAYLDAGNLHTYPGGFVPTRNMDLQIANQAIISGSKPVVVTEAGYHDAMASTGKHYPAPEEVAGTYVPRLMLEYHKRGVRSYLYELFEQNPEPAYTDMESHFGLVRADGTPKPAYHAVRNMVRLTADPGEAFTPGALSYSAASSAAGLKQTLLQRRDGTFVLLLWRDVAVWDPIAKVHLKPAPAAVNVRLGDAAKVTTHRPSRSADPQAVATDVHELSLEVGADVTALVIEPVPAPAPAPEPVPDMTSPVTTPDAHLLDEDAALTQPAAGVLANDVPGSGGAPVARLVDGPDHGKLTLQADGSFTYAPEPDYAGADAFTYVAEDADSGGTPAVVDLTVQPVNDAPVAQDDSYSVGEDAVLAAAAGVLANDVDVDADAVSALVSVPPAHGTVALAADGTFTYTPHTDYSGPDSFGYRAVDAAGATDAGHVTLTVGATNDAPTASDVTYGTTEDTPLRVPAVTGLVSTGFDADADVLTPIVVGRPALGTLTVGPDGALEYVPHPDAAGNDSFTYQLSDGTDLSPVATATVRVAPVNDLPLAAADSYRTSEDRMLLIPAQGIIANDTDADGDALVAALRVAPAHGTAVVRLDGSFVYTPHADWSGTDWFDYRVNDGTGVSQLARVTVQVDPVNDAPVNSLPAALSVPRGTPLTLSAATGTRPAVSDVDAGARVQVSIATTNGGTTLSTRSGLTFQTGDGVGDRLMVFRGTPAAVNAALDGATFRPKKGFAGAAGLTLTSDDLSGTATARDVDTLSITVR